MLVNAKIKDVLTDTARFKTIVAGRRFGKTHLALMWILGGYLKENDRRWVVMPTYRQGKMVVFPILRQLLSGKFGKINETDLSFKFENGAEIAVKGADNQDSLRGVSLNKVVLDEYAYMKPMVWEEIIYPSLADTRGKALFIGTPDGYNHFYDIYQKGLGFDLDWKSWQFKTVEGGFVPQDEI